MFVPSWRRPQLNLDGRPSGSSRQYDGEVDDYALQGSRLTSTEFPFTKFIRSDEMDSALREIEAEFNIRDSEAAFKSTLPQIHHEHAGVGQAAAGQNVAQAPLK